MRRKILLYLEFLVLFFGMFLSQRIELLRKYYIPPAVTGGPSRRVVAADGPLSPP